MDFGPACVVCALGVLTDLKGLVFGCLSGVSTCGTGCLTVSLLALPALFAPIGRGTGGFTGWLSQHVPDTRQQLQCRLPLRYYLLHLLKRLMAVRGVSCVRDVDIAA